MLFCNKTKGGVDIKGFYDQKGGHFYILGLVHILVIVDKVVCLCVLIGALKARVLFKLGLVATELLIAEAGREWEQYVGLKQAIPLTVKISSKSRGKQDYQAKNSLSPVVGPT